MERGDVPPMPKSNVSESRFERKETLGEGEEDNYFNNPLSSALVCIFFPLHLPSLPVAQKVGGRGGWDDGVQRALYILVPTNNQSGGRRRSITLLLITLLFF